ncbi:MAG: YihY/virulence factor BrkB family protein [Pseudoxanthomonas sp.]
MAWPQSARLQPLLERLRRSLPVALAQRFAASDLMTQAAALAFYALLSLAPLLVILLWITASLMPSAQAALLGQVGQLAGPQAQQVADTVVANASRRPDVGSLTGLWSTLLLFVGATAVFAQLQRALNLIFEVDRSGRRPGLLDWLKKRVFSFGAVLGLGFLLVVSMTAATILQVAFAGLPSVLPVLGNGLTLAVYVVVFAFLYHYLPDRPVAWRQSVLGAVITSGLFIAGRHAIGLYLARADPGSAYGPMGALVLLVVWIYYAAVVFFAGALLTAVIDERMDAARTAAADDERQAHDAACDEG